MRGLLHPFRMSVPHALTLHHWDKDLERLSSASGKHNYGILQSFKCLELAGWQDAEYSQNVLVNVVRPWLQNISHCGKNIFQVNKWNSTQFQCFFLSYSPLLQTCIILHCFCFSEASFRLLINTFRNVPTTWRLFPTYKDTFRMK